MMIRINNSIIIRLPKVWNSNNKCLKCRFNLFLKKSLRLLLNNNNNNNKVKKQRILQIILEFYVNRILLLRLFCWARIHFKTSWWFRLGLIGNHSWKALRLLHNSAAPFHNSINFILWINWFGLHYWINIHVPSLHTI